MEDNKSLFRYDGKDYTREQIDIAAAESGLSFDDYISEFGLEPIDPIKKITATVGGATVDPKPKAPSTASKPVTTSSASKSSPIVPDPVKQAKQNIDSILSNPFSADELDNIEAQVNAKPSVGVTATTFVGGMGGGVPVVSKKPTYPYESQINVAKKQLGVGATEQQINDLAKNLYREELKSKLVKSKVDNVLNQLEDETNNWQSVGEFFESGLVTLSNLGLSGSGQGVQPAKSTKEKRYEAARQDVSAYATQKLNERQKLVNKSVAGAKLASAVVETNINQLKEIEKNIKNSQDAVERNDLINQYNAVLDDTKSAAVAFEEYNGEVRKNIDYVNYGSQIVKDIPKSYNELDVFENRVFTTALTTAANLAEFGETGSLYMLKAHNPYVDPQIIKATYATPAESFGEDVREITDAASVQVRDHRPLGDISSWSDFGEFMVDLAGDQAFNTGLMFATGGVAGGALLGAGAAGGKMTEMWDARARGENISDAKFLGTAIIYGGAEWGSEYIGFGQLKRSSKILADALDQGAVTMTQLGESFGKKLGSGLQEYGVNVSQEGFTEAVSQLGQNIADITLLGQNKSIFEGVEESFVTGSLMSGLMFQAPTVVAGTVKLFNTVDEVKQVDINQKEINRLKLQSIELSKQIKQKENEGADAAEIQGMYSNKKQIDDVIDDLALANTALMQTGIERIDNLRDIEKSAVIEQSKKIAFANSLIKKYQDMIDSSVDLDESTTSDLISEIKKLNEYKDSSIETINDIIKESDFSKTLDKAYSAIEQFSSSENGVPTDIMKFNGDIKTTYQMQQFLESDKFAAYVEKRYGKEKLQQIKNEAYKQIKLNAGKSGLDAFKSNESKTKANALFLTFPNFDLADGTEVEMPRFIVLNTKNGLHHETGHATLFSAIRESYGTDILSTMSDSLLTELNAIFESDPDKYEYASRFIKKRVAMYEQQHADYIKKYANHPEIENITAWSESRLAEEKLIAFLDYIKDSKLEVKNEARLKNIFKAVSNVLGKDKMQTYNVRDGKDVMNMLRSFNMHFDKKDIGTMIRSINEKKLLADNKLSEIDSNLKKSADIFRKIMKSFASLADDIKPSAHPNSIQADKVNKLYEEKGVEAAYEIAELYGGMLRNVLRRFKYLPNYDNFVEDIMDAVKYGDRGLFGLIKSFDPERGVPLAAYINKYLSKRALGYITEYLNPEAGFMKDVTEQKGLMAEEEYDFEIDKPERSHSVIRKFLGLSEDQMNKVRKAVINALVFNPDIHKKRKWVPSEFKSELLKSFELDLFNLVKSDIFPSKNQDWYQYADQMYEWIINEVPMEVWLRSGVSIFYEPDIDPVNNKQKRMTPGEAEMAGVADINSGRYKWIPKKPTKEQWMEYIKAEGINPNTGKPYSWTTVGTRKDTIAKILAREMAFDATLEVLQNPEQPTYDFDGNPDGGSINVIHRMTLMSGQEYNKLAVVAQVADIINRDPRVMFSLSDGGSVDNRSAAAALFAEAELIFQEMEIVSEDVSDLADAYSSIIIDILDEKMKAAGMKPMSETKKLEIIESVLAIKFKDESKESEAWNKIRTAGMISVAKSLSQARAKSKTLIESNAQTAREIANEIRQEIGLSMTAREKELSDRFNKLLEKTFGIKQGKVFSDFDAQVAASKRSILKSMELMPVTAEDFIGLLYRTLSPGKDGEDQMAFYRKFLLYPFYDGATRHDAARVRILSGYKKLIQVKNNKHKQFKKIAFGNYTIEHVIRIAIWNKTGESISGISSEDVKSAIDFARKMPWVNEIADDIIEIMAPDGYGKPQQNWFLGNIENDLYNAINGHVRKNRMKEFATNADAIFNEYNMNKIQAVLGGSYRFALQNTLERMKSGKNRIATQNAWERKLNNWINGSVGAIMFLNMRSAVLQLVSMGNYINWSDNNPVAIAKAYANTKQMGQDILKLWNSDFMVTRRDGRKIDINEAELVEMLEESGANLGKIINWIIQKGFTPTQVADSMAIILGGAPFYRNRVNTYLKEGMDQKKAEEKAFLDFRETTEESQQSSRPDRISPQQSSSAGRIILAFANTPAQYSRLMIKAAKDIKNGRGDLKTNLSKIAYYAIIQNMIFSYMQQGLFALLFSDDEEEVSEKEATDLINSAADSILRGFGIQGAIISTLKNVAIEYGRQAEAGRFKSDKILLQAASISPPIGNKVRKINNIMYNSSQVTKEAKKTGEYDFTSRPTLEIAAGAIELGTNLPLTRALSKYDNVISAMNEDTHVVLRTAMLFGWPEWQLIKEEDEKSYKPMSQDEFVEQIKSKQTEDSGAMSEEDYINSLNKK